MVLIGFDVRFYSLTLRERWTGSAGDPDLILAVHESVRPFCVWKSGRGSGRGPRPQASCVILVDDRQDLFGAALQDHSGRAVGAVEGVIQAVEIPGVDGIAEKLRRFLHILAGDIQNGAHFVGCLAGVLHEIIDQGIALGQNAGLDGRVPEEGVHLFRGEMP